MASIVQNLVPPANLTEDIPIWYRIGWSPEVRKRIFQDWGAYYSRKNRQTFAMYYYDKALEIEPEDYESWYLRSRSKRKTGQIQAALDDCRQANRILRSVNIDSAPINLEICNGLYELNQFEDAKIELHNNAGLFEGHKALSFLQRLLVVDENISDALGNGLTSFIKDHDDIMYYVHNIWKSNVVDTRPYWKIIRDQGKCDVQSIPDIKEVLISPIEVARRRRAFNVFNQDYMGKAWLDVVFLKNLRKDPTLTLDQCPISKELLTKLTNKQYDVVKTFLKMLHAREPMYHKRYLKYSNPSLRDKFHENFLYRTQYQTRRNMIMVFRNIRRLRENQEITKLENFIEEVMGDYVVVKTSRIMPWKFEFMNEIYNSLALAFITQYKVPARFTTSEKNALLRLLHLPLEKPMEQQGYVFGVNSRRLEPDYISPRLLNAKKLIARLEKRLIFTKTSIERTYLYHQIAINHFRIHRYDECCFTAHKGIDASHVCNSNIWGFLSHMLIVKSHAALNKFKRTRSALVDARKASEKLNSPSLEYFVDVCLGCNEERALAKKPSSIASARESKLSDWSQRTTSLE